MSSVGRMAHVRNVKFTGDVANEQDSHTRRCCALNTGSKVFFFNFYFTTVVLGTLI